MFYEERLTLGILLKLILIGLSITFAILIGFLIFQEHFNGVLILGFEFSGILFLFYAIVPKRLQAFTDRIVVVCGIFKINLLFQEIESIEILPPSAAYASLKGARFTTANGQKTLLIKRYKKTSIIIQPQNTEDFIRVLREYFKNIDIKNN